MRPRRLLLALLVVVAGGGFTARSPASRADWLREHVAVLEPSSTDSGRSRLEALRAGLEGRDMVLLGEATRGDGSTFTAKTEVIRFLHEEMGFDALVFECGLLECDSAWRAIQAGEPAGAALENVLLPTYTESEQFGGLLDLIERRARGDRPLEIAGMDCQVGERGAEDLSALVDEALAAENRGAADREELHRIVRELAASAHLSGQAPLPDPASQARIDRRLRDLEETLSAQEAERSAFLAQLIANLRSALELTWAVGVWNPARVMDPEIHNLRDRQMTENLLWLRRHRFHGRKIIVWTLTLHAARDLSRLETGEVDTRERFRRFELLGDRLARALDPDPYVIAFTAFEGTKGAAGARPHPLLVATPGSFEDLMGRTGVDEAFVDLRRLEALPGGKWLGDPLIARPIAFKELRGVWSRHVDGFYFLRRMEAAREVDADRGLQESR